MRTAILLALMGMTALFASSAAIAGLCSGGYCANDESPVVGGWITESQYQGRTCTSYGNTKNGRTCLNWQNTYADVPGVTFGNVNGSGSSVECPVNTAEISFPNGYRANNGNLYSGSDGSAVVCAKADTFGG